MCQCIAARPREKKNKKKKKRTEKKKGKGKQEKKKASLPATTMLPAPTVRVIAGLVIGGGEILCQLLGPECQFE